MNKYPYRSCLILALCTYAGLLSGCKAAKQTDMGLLLFPSPPAAPRVQFLTWASGAEQVEPERSSFDEFLLGNKMKSNPRIIKPYGVAARDGVIYVCDTKGLCINRLDFKTNQYSVFGNRGLGRLRKPINIEVDDLGYKFVVDPVLQQVVVFNPKDQFVRAFDVPKPCHPVDIALHDSEIYVLDNDSTCQIVVMDRRTGKTLRTFGSAGGDPGQFKIPGSIAISEDGYLYVSDTHNWRIQKMTLTGESVWIKGTPGYTLGQFGRPRGIQVGPDGNIYLVDGAMEIVQMFDPDGNVLMRFGEPGNAPGAMGLPASIALDKTSIPFFQKYIHPDFDIEYLLIVTNQFGSHLINIYAYGSFPKGYEIKKEDILELPKTTRDKGMGPANEKLEQQPGNTSTQSPPDAEKN